jgi:hypothetical protein
MGLRYAVYRQLEKAANGIPIICVTWYPFDCAMNLVTGPGKRGNLNVHKQIVIGANALDVDILFMAEHDVLYHKEHFKFTPPEKGYRYFNENKWRFRLKDGVTAFRHLPPGAATCLSQACGYKEDILTHYGHTGRVPKKKFFSRSPNIDIRHGKNYTKTHAFRSPSILADGVPFWGKSEKIMKRL